MKTTLHNRLQMPLIGLGTYKMTDEKDITRSIHAAFEAGYRSIDTASIYGNELEVGNAIKSSGVARSEIFLTTKLWNDDMRNENFEAAFEESLDRLQTDYLDLYLLHWPIAGKIKESWAALEKLFKQGRVKAIGVCNFTINQLQELLANAEIVPMINQIELHPYLTQNELVNFCNKNNIRITAWRPIMRGDVNKITAIIEIAKRHQKTPVQVVLRWLIQKNIITIPKSVNRNRIFENINIFDFKLNNDEENAINALNQDKRFGPDPEDFNF